MTTAHSTRDPLPREGQDEGGTPTIVNPHIRSVVETTLRDRESSDADVRLSSFEAFNSFYSWSRSP